MKRLFNKKDKSTAASVDANDGQQQPYTNGGTAGEGGRNAAQQLYTGPQYMGPGGQQVPQGYVLMHAPVLVPVSASPMRPPPPTQVSNAIDHLSSSSAASKEAAKALRKEFKHATPEAQERAVRLTGILMRNTDVRFREQVASKKFLADLSDMSANKKTDPRVKDMIVRVLSPLAFEYQRDADLNSITTLYNKIKSPEAPINGLPLDPDDPLLQPTVDPRTSGNMQGRRRAPQRLPSQSEQLSDLRRQAEQARGDARLLSDALSYARPEDDIRQNEIVQEFHLKCFEAQEFLSNNLQWATVQAEQSRTAVDQASVTDGNITDTEDHVIRADSKAQIQQGDDARLSSNNPFAPIVSGERPMPPPSRPVRETREEATLAVLLAAHSEVLEALQAYDHHTQMWDEMRDVRAAEERSKVETKFDRTRAGSPDQDGYYRENRGEDPFVDAREQEQSGSRNLNDLSGGVVHVPIQQRSTASSPPNRNPYAAYLSSTASTTSSQRVTPSESEHEPKMEYGGFVIPDSFDSQRNPSVRQVDPLSITTASNGSASGPTHPVTMNEPLVDTPSSPFAGNQRRDTSESASEGLQTPVVPSEKALGKLRRVSIREDSDSLASEDQQARLEQALREKYARNYNEHHGNL
ncbi:hypothetical protein OIV83_004773 [Microbotryomycetes sp. JL201]|nr:hypothetical protein OIV83_004773 [Microbotryomycetes sp. JL201]